MRRGFIRTDKTLGPGQTGEPPFKLKQLFGLLVTDELVTREGTIKTPASILACVLKDELKTLQPKERLARIEKERRRLSEVPESLFNVCAQETWNIGAKNARDILKDPTAHLDPRLFYSLLEYVYKCKLVLFGRDDFIYPFFGKTFAHFSSNHKVIIAYENYGGEAEHLTVPQWETFNGLNIVHEVLCDKYSAALSLLYVDDRGNADLISFPTGEEKGAGEVVAQHLDDYGQTIRLNIRTADEKVSTFQLPYPISPLPILKTDELFSNERARRLNSVPVVYGDQTFILGNLVPVLEKRHSWMQDFLTLRRTSQRLIEQAKYATSRGNPISIGALTQVDGKMGQKWAGTVRVPFESTRKKLDFAVKMYKKYNPVDFARMKDYVVVPNVFSHIDDFEPRRGQIVSSSSETLDWSQTGHILRARPSLCEANFFMELGGRVYNCLAAPRSGQVMNANVCVWNTRTIFEVGAPTTSEISWLFYLVKRVPHVFECVAVKRN